MDDNTTTQQANPEDVLPKETVAALKPLPEWLRKMILEQLYYEYLKGQPMEPPTPEHHITTLRVFFELSDVRRTLRGLSKDQAAWQRKIETQITQFQQQIQKAVQDSLMETENILLELQAGKMKPSADAMGLVLEALEAHKHRLDILEVKTGLRRPPQNPQNPQQK